MKIYSLPFLLAFLLTLNDEVSVQKESDDASPKAAKIIFRSNDGGQTWIDISEGLPEYLGDDLGRDDLSANDNGIYLHTGEATYHSKPNATAPFWKKENAHRRNVNVSADSAFNDESNVVKPSGRVIDSNGVMLATSQKGIVRSTDGGKTWRLVISEGGVGIAVERIEGGFAAITYNGVQKARRVRTSYDGGKTWQAIDAGLPPSLLIASIIEVGNNFFCGHPEGIFKSSDKGKTWTLILPSVGDKVFNLFVSGNVIFAIARPGGC